MSYPRIWIWWRRDPSYLVTRQSTTTNLSNDCTWQIDQSSRENRRQEMLEVIKSYDNCFESSRLKSNKFSCNEMYSYELLFGHAQNDAKYISEKHTLGKKQDIRNHLNIQNRWMVGGERINIGPFRGRSRRLVYRPGPYCRLTNWFPRVDIQWVETSLHLTQTCQALRQFVLFDWRLCGRTDWNARIQCTRLALRQLHIQFDAIWSRKLDIYKRKTFD